jgi:flagellin-like hook-associated protein FlgL
LTKEVDRISTDTEYNSKTLLDGSCNTRSYSKEVERLDVSEHVVPGDYELKVTEVAQKATCEISIPDGAPEGTIEINNVSMDYTQELAADADAFYEKLRDTAEQAGCDVERTLDNTDPANPKWTYTITSVDYGKDESFSVVFSRKLGEYIQDAQGLPQDEKLNEVVNEGVADPDEKWLSVATFTPNFNNGGLTADSKISVKGQEATFAAGIDLATFEQDLKTFAQTVGCEVSQENGTFTLKGTGDGDQDFSIGIEGDYHDTLNVTTEEVDEVKYRLTMLDPNDPTKELGDPQGKDAKLDKITGFSSTATCAVDGNRVRVTDSSGFSMDFLLKDTTNKVGEKVDIQVTDIGAMTIQIGANQYQEMDVRIPEVSAKSLYLDTVDVTVTKGPDKALITLDEAISKLGDVRSGIGAYTNRLEHATSSLAETQEDLTSAFSTLVDTDMAEEMTEYTQQNVLEQAAISVLAQANDLPGQVLALLQ